MADESQHDRTNPAGAQEPESASQYASRPFSRRSFLKGAGLGAFFAAGTGLALTPLLKYDNDLSVESLTQQYYHRLTPEKMEKILRRLEKEVKERHGVDCEIQDQRSLPAEEVQFAYALNIGRCIGCRRCVHACVEENNQSRHPEIQYIRVLEMPTGTLNVEESNHYYDHEKVPVKGKFYMPVQCQQCVKAACVKACPVKATWREEDGLVVVDYNWCIGCRYCEAACPFWARRFNFAEPNIPKEDINPKMAYLSNRIRPRGVMEKCTFCLQRVRQGKLPKCVEVCPTGSRQFGNLLDPNSPIRYILDNKRVYIFKQDVGTEPRFYYWFDK